MTVKWTPATFGLLGLFILGCGGGWDTGYYDSASALAGISAVNVDCDPNYSATDDYYWASAATYGSLSRVEVWIYVDQELTSQHSLTYQGDNQWYDYIAAGTLTGQDCDYMRFTEFYFSAYDDDGILVDSETAQGS